eukprot:s61_g7.t1
MTVLARWARATVSAISCVAENFCRHGRHVEADLGWCTGHVKRCQTVEIEMVVGRSQQPFRLLRGCSYESQRLSSAVSHAPTKATKSRDEFNLLPCVAHVQCQISFIHNKFNKV